MSQSADTGCSYTTTPLRILLVTDRKDDFVMVRDLLSRTDGAMPAELEQATSWPKARECLARVSYDLILLAYAGQDATGRLIAEVRQRNITAPLVCLTEASGDFIVAETIHAGVCSFVPRTELNELSLSRPLRCALNMHHQRQERRDAEEMLRKLSRAVEQSADLVIITDRE